MTSENKLEDLELSQLTEPERQTLESMNGPHKLCFKVSLFLTVIMAIGIYQIWSKIPTSNTFLALGALKLAGYIGLGYWTRSWSSLAVMLLIAWHIYYTRDLLDSDSLKLKLTFWIPLALYTFGLLATRVKAQLIKKAQASS